MSADAFYDIPAGHIAKVLTPNGWQKGVIEAGQVNLGGEDMDNRRNTLVFLEATAVQVKEQFGVIEGVDNRIMTSGRGGAGQIPLTIDVYLRLRVPADEALRNRVFAEITPQGVKDSDGRVSKINVSDVYYRYAMQEARSLLRQIIGSYADDIDINAKRSEIEQKLTVALLERFKNLQVPLELQSVSLSNVAADAQIQQGRNQSSAANAQVAAIEQVGQALTRNPGYVRLREIEMVEKTAGEAAKAGKPATFIIGISGDAHPYAARSVGN
jgi:hypothetical protein